MESKTVRYTLSIALYVVFAILLVFMLRQKVNLNVDEVYSYGLSNHYDGTGLRFKNGKKYIPSDSIWMDYMTVSKDHAFDYVNVWRNQEKDVHPPFYYVILHTICSFFPGKFSIWFGGVINILFGLLSIFMIGKLVSLYTDSFYKKIIMQALFVASPGIYNMGMFLRMYMMTSFCLLCFIYQFIKMMRTGESIKLYVLITVCTVFCTMTHYYCMIFIAFLSVCYGVYCLFSKRIKSIVLYAVSMGISAGASLLIFPGMIHHFFDTNRGQQTIENAANGSLFQERFVREVVMILSELFATPLLWILLIGAFLVTGFYLHGKKLREIFDAELILLALAIIIYVMFVAITAPFEANRYFFPIYGCLFFVSLMPLVKVTLLQKHRGLITCITALLVIVVGIKAWTGFSWSYMDSNTRDSLEWAGAHENLDCILVHGRKYTMHTCFYEVAHYASCTPVNLKKLKKLPAREELEDKDFVVLLTDTDEHEKYLEEISERYPGHTYSKVGFSAYHTSYYFEKTN